MPLETNLDMDKTGLAYNTERERIILSEYGRGIQEMVESLQQIEDRQQRTQAAHRIVALMAQMNPQVKESADYQHKLWDHLYIISDFKLDVDSPYAPPVIEKQRSKPHHINYQNNDIRYGHYGTYIVKMIEAACKEERPEVREALAYSIASQMKANYMEWNKSVISDQVIIDDLKNISKGVLVLPDDAKLSVSGEAQGKMQSQGKKQSQQQGKKKKKKVPNLKANMNNPNNPAYKKRMEQ